MNNGGRHDFGKVLQQNMVTSKQHIKPDHQVFVVSGCATSAARCVVYVHGMTVVMDAKAKQRRGGGSESLMSFHSFH